MKRMFTLKLHDHTAIAMNRLTSDVLGGVVQRQEFHQAGNFFRLAVSTGRNGGENLLFQLFTQNRRHVGGDEARGDGVALNQPRPAYSRAIVFVKPITPAFAAE